MPLHSPLWSTSCSPLCIAMLSGLCSNLLLASCPWGPVTANGVDLLTEIYVTYMERKNQAPRSIGCSSIGHFMRTHGQTESQTIIMDDAVLLSGLDKMLPPWYQAPDQQPNKFCLVMSHHIQLNRLVMAFSSSGCEVWCIKYGLHVRKGELDNGYLLS